MDNSILSTIKKMLGLDADYDAFDTDIIIHINSALMNLMQMGVGPSTGFSINGDFETWPEFFGTYTDLQGVKTYIYLKVRLVFDPPSTSFVIDAIQKQIAELEWRLNIQTERLVADVAPTV